MGFYFQFFKKQHLRFNYIVPLRKFTFYHYSTWKSLDFNPCLVDALHKQGISKPNLLQIEAIPKIQTQEDIVLTAETGSGKTLTYLLPILEDLSKLNEVPKTKLPLALILVPTKELSWQVGSVLIKFNRYYKHLNLELAFNTSELKTFNESQKKIILITTPTALVQTTQSELMRAVQLLTYVRWVVCDEADILLSRTFGGKTQSLLAQLNKLYNGFKRQFIFVGASLNPSLSQKALQTYLLKKFPSAIYINSKNKHKTVSTLSERFIKAPEDLNGADLLIWKLEDITKRIENVYFKNSKLSIERPEIVLIFWNSISNVSGSNTYLSSYYQDNPLISTYAFHKELNKKDREEILKLLKIKSDSNDDDKMQSNTLKLISTTDVLARGIDLELDLVIQADFPGDITSYLHRSGRTARAGRKGEVISYITAEDGLLANQVLEIQKNKSKAPGLNESNYDNLFSRRRSLSKKLKAKIEVSSDPEIANR